MKQITMAVLGLLLSTSCMANECKLVKDLPAEQFEKLQECDPRIFLGDDEGDSFFKYCLDVQSKYQNSVLGMLLNSPVREACYGPCVRWYMQEVAALRKQPNQ